MQKTIGSVVKKLREEAGFSIRGLAQESGLSPAYVSKLEDGLYKSLSLKSSKALSKGLGLSLGDFLNFIGYLKADEKRPSHLIIKNAFRSDGFTNADVNEIMEYARYIRNKREG